MELADELTTPGCPQCAVKHLSAALSYVVDMDPVTRGDLAGHVEPDGTVFPENILLARALVNYAEVCAGYRSHLPFVVGLLERAERQHVMTMGTGTSASDDMRNLRLVLQSGGTPSHEDLAKVSNIGTLSYAWAHIIEAQRELPSLRPVRMDAEDLQNAIAEIKSEYFAVSTVGAGTEETTPTGEPEMATAKKKPAVKGKGACKGGKCCDKGGKSKK